MKVLIIITRGDTIGGAQSHVILLADQLKKQGCEVLVVVGGVKSKLYENLFLRNVEVIHIPHLKRAISFFSDIKSFFSLKKIINSYNPDIVSLHSSKVGIIGRLASMSNNSKCVLTVHGWFFESNLSSFKKKIFLSLEKHLSRFCDKIILVSNFDYNKAIEYSIAPASKLIVIHNGVEDNSSLIKKRNFNDKIINIGMVARFDKQKDQRSLILACKNLQYVKLHFFGDGVLLKQLKQLVIDLDISKRVFFYGFTHNIIDALNSIDVFALISNYEGFPISTLEAMSMGKALLLSNVGGTCECLIDGVNGVMIETNSIDEIRNAINLNFKDFDKLTEMGIKSLNIFLTNFTSEIMVKKTINVYNNILIR
jgi:glycosyltransferase involved in cell wall biosynthesis